MALLGFVDSIRKRTAEDAIVAMGEDFPMPKGELAARAFRLEAELRIKFDEVKRLKQRIIAMELALLNDDRYLTNDYAN